MEDLKLYKIYHLGATPCWDLKVAHSAEDALTQCFEHRKFPRPDSAADSSCRAEEVTIPGFLIRIEPQ